MNVDINTPFIVLALWEAMSVYFIFYIIICHVALCE